jgi:hypothetical protein
MLEYERQPDSDRAGRVVPPLRTDKGQISIGILRVVYVGFVPSVLAGRA